MLMPSSVMLIVLLGSPLTVELRAVPEVLKPGSPVSESRALRLVSGRLAICTPVMLVAIAGDCVCTTVADSPTTVTFSSRVPTASVTFTLAGSEAFRVTELNTAVLNPINDTVTVYVPPGSDGTAKPPSLAVTVLYSAPVPLFLILTSAPGMTAPDESATVPDSELKKLPCASATVLAAATIRHASTPLRTERHPIASNLESLQGLTKER